MSFPIFFENTNYNNNIYLYNKYLYIFNIGKYIINIIDFNDSKQDKNIELTLKDPKIKLL